MKLANHPKAELLFWSLFLAGCVAVGIVWAAE